MCMHLLTCVEPCKRQKGPAVSACSTSKAEHTPRSSQDVLTVLLFRGSLYGPRMPLRMRCCGKLDCGRELAAAQKRRHCYDPQDSAQCLV